MTTAKDKSMYQATEIVMSKTPTAMPLPKRRINMRSLKHGLEKIEAEIGESDFTTWPPIDQATGIVWREDGLIVSRTACAIEDGFVWVLKWADCDGWAGVVGEFCRQFGKLARRTGLFGDNSKSVFYRCLADLIVAPSEDNSVLAQLIEQTLRIAQEWDNLFVANLRRQSDAGDPESQFVLYEILNDKGSLHYNRKSAASLLKKSAYQGYPKACSEFLEDMGEGETRRELLAHLHSLGLQGNETAYIFWAATVLSDIGKDADARSYPELSADAKVTKEVFQVLRHASRNGNGDATWALYQTEQDTTKAAKLLCLASKQGHVLGTFVLACSLITGENGQTKDFRKAHRTFLRLYHLNDGRFPGWSQQGHFYVWAYACIESGVPFPQELSRELDRLRLEPDQESDGLGVDRRWSYDLLDALREYAKTRKTDLFPGAIIQAEWDWQFEGPDDDKGNVLDEFFQAGELNLGRSLLFGEANHDQLEQCAFPRIIEKLCAIANKGVHEVQYILGLMGDTTDDWLGLASDGGFALASYHLGFSRYASEPEAALRHLKRVAYQAEQNEKDSPKTFEVSVRNFDEKKTIVSEWFFNEMRNKALTRIREIEARLSEENSRRQTERDMLAYLSHTLNNLLASGPESARAAMRILGTDLYENNREAKAINNIATMFSTFLFAQKLLETFKLYIVDPVSLRKSWESDNEGNSSVSVVMSLALRQTLSQIVFASNHQEKLQRLLPHKEAGAIKEIRKSFIEEMIPLDIDAANAGKVLNWVGEHMPGLQIEVDPVAECHFDGNNTRFTFFFASFSELIYNALKYSDALEPVTISWRLEASNYVFRCSNAWSADSMNKKEKGTKKGLSFLGRLVEMLGASLVKEISDNKFIIEIRLPVGLLKDN